MAEFFVHTDHNAVKGVSKLNRIYIRHICGHVVSWSNNVVVKAATSSEIYDVVREIASSLVGKLNPDFKFVLSGCFDQEIKGMIKVDGKWQGFLTISIFPVDGHRNLLGSNK